MPSKRQIAGMKAEAYAAVNLENLGWELLAKNLRTPYAEVDLFMLSPSGQPVVVEVKARSTGSWVEGEDCLGAQQRSRLFRAAEWLSQQRHEQQMIRVDLVLVELIGGNPVHWSLLQEIGLN
ncbi:MAG: YraN family protein [Planctomycetota bacterium]